MFGIKHGDIRVRYTVVPDRPCPLCGDSRLVAYHIHLPGLADYYGLPDLPDYTCEACSECLYSLPRNPAGSANK